MLWAMLFVSVTVVANSQYPQNPCNLDQHLYVGETGLKKFDYTTQSYVWSVLQHHSTFEPVCAGKFVFIGSRNGLYAIDSNKGSVLWSIGEGETLFSPVVNGKHVYVSSQNGIIRKLQIDSGKLIWEKQLKGWLYPPVVIDDRVVVGGQGRELYAFNVDNGDLLWQRHVEQELVYRPIAAKQDIVIITTYGPDVIAINTKNNKILWSKKEVSAPYSPVVDNDQVFYGDQNGIFHAVNLYTGDENWHKQLSGVIRSIPTIDSTHRNTVWVGTERGQLVALNEVNGTIRWQKLLHQAIVHSPLPLSDKIYFKVDSRNLRFEPYSLSKTVENKVNYNQ